MSSFEFIVLENYDINNLSLISVKSFVSATILGLVCTAFAIFIFFSLINKESAVFASQSNYLIPCFGSLWGILFLNEIVTSNMFVGLLLIVFSGWLVNKKTLNFYFSLSFASGTSPTSYSSYCISGFISLSSSTP